MAITANNGDVFAPVPVAPVKATALGLFPDGLQALPRVTKEVGGDLKGAYLNRDGGFDGSVASFR